MLKYTFVFLFSLFPISVCAQTVIYYEDGSVYTVQPNERVYVETARKLYTKRATKTAMSISPPKHPTTRLTTSPNRMMVWC